MCPEFTKILQGVIGGEVQVAMRDIVVIVLRGHVLPDFATLIVSESIQWHVFNGAMVLIMLV